MTILRGKKLKSALKIGIISGIISALKVGIIILKVGIYQSRHYFLQNFELK
jgi:hypothetical protein